MGTLKTVLLHPMMRVVKHKAVVFIWSRVFNGQILKSTPPTMFGTLQHLLSKAMQISRVQGAKSGFVLAKQINKFPDFAPQQSLTFAF
jgi:hypothetical protein